MTDRVAGISTPERDTNADNERMTYDMEKNKDYIAAYDKLVEVVARAENLTTKQAAHIVDVMFSEWKPAVRVVLEGPKT